MDEGCRAHNTASWSGEFAPGDYVVELRVPEREPVSQRVTVTAGSDARVRFDAERR